MTHEHEQVVAERTELAAERDELSTERTELAAERDELRGALDETEQQLAVAADGYSSRSNVVEGVNSVKRNLPNAPAEWEEDEE